MLTLFITGINFPFVGSSITRRRFDRQVQKRLNVNYE